MIICYKIEIINKYLPRMYYEVIDKNTSVIRFVAFRIDFLELNSRHLLLDI